MEKLINMLSISGDVLIIYGLIGAMAVLLLVIFVMDYRSKKKNLDQASPIVIEGSTPIEKYETYDHVKENFEEPHKEEVPEQKIEEQPAPQEINEEKIEEKEKQEESIEIIEPKEENSSIKYVMKDEEEVKEEAKEELKELVQELKEDKTENIELTDFEVEQEENAIISYNELKKVSEELYDSNELTQYDEGNEPISIDQLRAKFKEVNDPISVAVATEEEKSDLVETIESLEQTATKAKVEERPKVKLDDFAVKTGEHKFKISPIISPVYGTIKEEQIENVEDFSSSTKLKLEQTANLEKLDEELRKTNEFLAVLKELQKKLD